jgi:hypothetical protein
VILERQAILVIFTILLGGMVAGCANVPKDNAIVSEREDARSSVLASLPFDAPAGSDAILADFLSICSQAVIDPEAAARTAKKRGWAAPAEDDISTMLRPSDSLHFKKTAPPKSISEILNETPFELGLSIIDYTYPQFEANACLLQGSVRPDVGLPKVELIGSIPGVFAGGQKRLHPGMKNQGWSYERSDGSFGFIDYSLDEAMFFFQMSNFRRAIPANAPNKISAK